MKCQDAEGKWHYGDLAAQECESSRITEIHESGTILKQTKPPATAEELEAKRRLDEKLARQQVLEEEQKVLDQRLLATYEDEGSIIKSRDSLLAAMDDSLGADQALKHRLEEELAALQQNGGKGVEEKAADLRAQIEDFDRAIRTRLAARELARNRYDAELERYRKLRGKTQ